MIVIQDRKKKAERKKSMQAKKKVRKKKRDTIYWRGQTSMAIEGTQEFKQSKDILAEKKKWRHTSKKKSNVAGHTRLTGV